MMHDRLSVLVVENGKGRALSLAEPLIAHGHRVRVARDPDALAAAAADPPDLLLLVSDAPGAGWELTRLCGARPGGPPFVVAVTGPGTTADRDRAAAAGVGLHLVEPVDPGLLVWAVSRARAARAPAADPPPAVVRVLLADDHPVVRAGLRSLLENQPGLEVVGEAADGRAAVALAAELDPDVVVVDVSLPDLSGAQVTAQLRAARPGRRVLAVSAHEDAAYVRSLRDAGAGGYVLKRSAPEDLVRAVRAVAAGGEHFDPEVAESAVGEAPVVFAPGAGLTEREEEVVRQVALGYSNKQIAARLEVSVKTVETDKSRALGKLNAQSRVDLVRYATRRGWLKAD